MVDGGMTRSAAAKENGVNRLLIAKWLMARDAGGDALDGGWHGCRPGEQPWLSAADGDRIRRLITDRCPDQLKLQFALWTCEAVRELIERETGVRLSLQAVSLHLERWDFTAQRPMHRATERREPAIQAWLETDYPAIEERAKAEKAEIPWADESGLSNWANYGRSFAPKGKTPVMPRQAKRPAEVQAFFKASTVRYNAQCPT